MINKICLCFFFLINILLHEDVACQSKDLELSYEVKSNNKVDFSYKKSKPGSYTIIVEFRNLSNAFYNKRPIVVDGNSGRAFTLDPSESNKKITFSYSYTYFPGALNPKVDEDIVYLLPFEDGVELTAFESPEANNVYLGSKEPKDWKTYNFYTNEVDLVCAARKGIVVDVQEDHNLNSMVEYTSKKNYILIENPDGTKCRYAGFGKNGVLVEVGDVVYPKTPIGRLKQGDNYGQLFFQVYFLTLEMENEITVSSKYLHQYLTPKFFVDNSESILVQRSKYVVESNEKYVIQEMTRREKKKRMK